MSHRSKCSFILTKFITNLFFKQDEPPLASQVVSRKRLKTPASIICLFWRVSKLLRIRKKY